jgi:hypothetical protein
MFSNNATLLIFEAIRHHGSCFGQDLDLKPPTSQPKRFAIQLLCYWKAITFSGK